MIPMIDMKKDTFHILAKNEFHNNNTWKTGINNNVVVIGPSGAGKTRYYVKPNIMQCNESMIIADTKSSLHGEVGDLLRQKGYKVIRIDFSDLSGSYGYNPLDYIRYDSNKKRYYEQDIMSLAACLCPIEDNDEPFWDLSARMYIACMIGYVLECLPRKEHTLEFVTKMCNELGNKNIDLLFDELYELNPKSFSANKYFSFCSTKNAEKTFSCIRGIIAEKMDMFSYNDAIDLVSKKDRIDFKQLGVEKTAVFLNISDTDRSMDRLVNIFYTQALQALCNSADKDYKEHRLRVPVRFYLDDFATNACIPDFDKIISVIRSRDIYVSIILQSITQLDGMYGHSKAMTILNNCDNMLYLGGQDIDTAKLISIKTNKNIHSILNLPVGESYLFTRGKEGKKVELYDIKEHYNYKSLPEAKYFEKSGKQEDEQVLQV